MQRRERHNTSANDASRKSERTYAVGNDAIETRPSKEAKGLFIITKHHTKYLKCTEAKPESENLKIQDSTTEYDDRVLRDGDLHQSAPQKEQQRGNYE